MSFRSFAAVGLLTATMAMAAPTNRVLAQEASLKSSKVQAESEEKTRPLSDKTPQVGDQAHDFSMPSLNDEEVSLEKLRKEGPVVIVLLRGFPGAQCPACSLQVGDFIQNAKKFREKGASVVLIYPGDEKELKAKSQEFLANVKMPANYYFILDPGYKFTELYGLRWDAPKETSYPSTYVVDMEGKVNYFKTSDTHKGRADAKEVLEAVR